MAWRTGAAVGSIFCAECNDWYHLSGSAGCGYLCSERWFHCSLGYQFSWAVPAVWLVLLLSVQMHLWVGVSLVVSGSGERERGAGGSPSAAWLARARSCWPLAAPKPGSGRHGARGHSRRLKCPFWMSSTQWGMWESDCAEGAVAGGLWAASEGPLTHTFIAHCGSSRADTGAEAPVQRSRQPSGGNRQPRPAMTHIFREPEHHREP